ncbi:T6SS phospholipase effector Tle1-like catalytic domain-containing protein [Sphingomonas mollis]|uniref:DUF2235 domain-containing protein n=1 Tax=Sphingomonas mollis TaxID=2795726 RepID=A0ABS0XMS2_9SPHN|nr:DUF2235 domain-containing protein [Sphingomonas sp. BT553]MBJ6121307.1 DUF2235 domain-containing protein [Sphingomonas sp. BT553]
MAKNVLIFSDGTGQIGGLRPDQRLSNIYKLYRAMRPGPDSPMGWDEQYAFYDPGLGAGEVGGLTFRRLHNMLAAAVGTGIDENVIDCYAAIIANYRPGDRICLFGFSRGAYTVRALANVLNLCGVPTRTADGTPVPRYGAALRRIASVAVKDVYNHGAGAKRAQYERQRETKAERFRTTYGSEGIGIDGEKQANVQPYFIGVFDTVAALGSRTATLIATLGFVVMIGLTLAIGSIAPWWLTSLAALVPAAALLWLLRIWADQFKYFFADPNRRVRWWNPFDWIAAIRVGHLAWWSGKHYDRYVDREVRYLRHALSLDEERTRFPFVPWARPQDLRLNEAEGRTDWLRPRWFAGNHSDIGGSYPEDESRLSDIALRWMVDEFTTAMAGSVKIRADLLVTSPDATGLQHDEVQRMLDSQPRWLRRVTGDRLTWRRTVRKVDPAAPLHPSVLERFAAGPVPQMGEMKPYRPASLRDHKTVASYYTG